MVEMTWREAIEKVLSAAAGAMHYKEISEEIREKGLRSNLGATPSDSVGSVLSVAITKEGDKCPFRRVSEGQYLWVAKGSVSPEKKKAEELDQAQYDIITSFGMFWRRDSVEWTSTPRILGMEQIGADPVDFQKQIGIYLLYDGRQVIYIGRATDRPLGIRLYEHTRDRFSSRWDRFSWFGLAPVSPKGILENMPKTYDAMKIIPALEAVLIEAFEPCQNRKRGDDLSAVEFIQIEDSEIQKKRAKQTLEKFLK